MDVKNGFVLATIITPVSVHDTNYLPYLKIARCRTEEPIKKVYEDKGHFREPKRTFLHLNEIKDSIMRNDTTAAKFTEFEIERNKRISKKTYTVEEYFGLLLATA